MSTLPLSKERNAPASQALGTGVAFAATVALFYGLCTVLWLVAPGPFLSFMNSLFHGMDFTPLLKPTAFAWGDFIRATLVMTVWSFLARVFFGWLPRRLGT